MPDTDRMAARGSEGLSIVVDGREVPAVPGEMVIAAAERSGTFIPRFCYHPRMRPVGMCRMCLVEIKGPRGFSLQPACFVEVSEGQEIVTDSAKVKKAQDGVLEFLLVNHPLDCPVCDKGGECPLQDQTLSYGPGESRFVEEKRHWEKPIPISSLVYLDRERCIQCGRCTRFAEEIAGEPLIDFYGRGDQIEVATYPDRPFSSYFSGNTVQICPVGALTASPYRFRARPWDVEQVESTCTTCSVGCRVVVQSSSNRLTRMLGVDSDPVNQSWLCDKGRFAIEAIGSDSRLVEPMVRKDGELVAASWSEALSAAAAGLSAAVDESGPESIAFLGGARLANEDAYAWAKLAKGALGTDSVDAQLGDGLPAEVVLGLPRATIDQTVRADAVVLVAPDLREELPVLYLRLRAAAADNGVPIIELSSTSTAMTNHVRVSLRHRPGEAAALAAALTSTEEPTREVAGVPPEDVSKARQVLAGADESGAGEGVVVVLGRPSVAESGATTADAAAVIRAARPAARFLTALRRGNIHGALDMGLAPGVLPGRVSLEAGREWFSRAWGSVPAEAGRDAAGILAAAGRGELGGLVLVGSDPLGDYPDRQVASAAFEGGAFVVAVDAFLTASSSRADVVLPAAVYAERAGTTTNLEGRVSRLGQRVIAQGVAWPDWMIACELASQLGADLGLDSLDAIWDEIERVCPSHTGVTRSLLEAPWARDGVVVPLDTTPVRLGGSRRADGSRADHAVPVLLDPMATPGIDAVERQGAPSLVGAALAVGSGDVPLRDRAGGARRSNRLESPPALRLEHRRSAEVPSVDSYSFRLVTARTLYDGGTAVRWCPALRPLAPALTLRLNPAELDGLGVAPGGRVRVRSSRTAMVVEAVRDPGVPRGVAVMPFGLDGEGPADLIDTGSIVTEVQVETIDG